MTMFRALDTAIDEDLAAFSAFLHARGVPHRIFEDGGRQVVAVGTEQHALVVREAYRRWRSGGLRLDADAHRAMPRPSSMARLAGALRDDPVTLFAMLLSAVGFAVVALEMPGVMRWLTFADIRFDGSRPVLEPALAAFARREYWRLLTPVFLHFGLLHITFNLLWYWELGRRLERQRGSMTALAVLLITGAGGNIMQYVFEPGVLFGGMSGVIYGLLGYIWMWNRFGGQPQIALPPGILPFMLAWLFICMSGIFEALGFGAIANAAHAAGLVLGMLLGLGAAILRERSRNDTPAG